MPTATDWSQSAPTQLSWTEDANRESSVGFDSALVSFDSASTKFNGVDPASFLPKTLDWSDRAAALLADWFDPVGDEFTYELSGLTYELSGATYGGGSATVNWTEDSNRESTTSFDSAAVSFDSASVKFDGVDPSAFIPQATDWT